MQRIDLVFFRGCCHRVQPDPEHEEGHGSLAIVARSGKFLPVYLTFGPVNGPDDFCFVVDRAFGPGRGRKARFAREWIAYPRHPYVQLKLVDTLIRTSSVFFTHIWFF